MINVFKVFLTTVFFTFLVTASVNANSVALEGAEVGKWTMDFDAALKLAQDKDLPLLLNFTGSDWCGWCKLMDKNVFAQAAFKEYASKEIVLVTLDFPRDKTIVPVKYVSRNQQLQSQFGVGGYPTYILLDSDGKTVLGQLGAGKNKTPEIFIEEMRNYFRFRDVEVEKYAKTLSSEQAAAYKVAVSALKQTQKDFHAWLDTEPLRNPENEKIYNDFVAKMKDSAQKVNEY